MQKKLDDLDQWLEKEKIEQFKLCGYSMYESEYDFDIDKTITRPVSKWEDVDIRESINKSMEGVCEDEDKLDDLWLEWREKEENIDDEYKKKRNGIIHNDDNY